MNYAVEDIAAALRNARKNKGLSQRALSEKAGVPQSHISKIESGTVDLRLSSLIELARVLDLEVTLVPRTTVPAIRSIVRSSTAGAPQVLQKARQALEELERVEGAIANHPKVKQATDEIAQFHRNLKDLRRLSLDDATLKTIREAIKSSEKLKDNQRAEDALNALNSKLRSLRNELAHRAPPNPQVDSPRPAYSLDEEDDDA